MGRGCEATLQPQQPPGPVPPTHRASTSAALSLATSLLRWRWLNCFFALSSSFTVSSSSACAFCSRSMPCGERQPGGTAVPTARAQGTCPCPGTFLRVLSLERRALRAASAARAR